LDATNTAKLSAADATNQPPIGVKADSGDITIKTSDATNASATSAPVPAKPVVAAAPKPKLDIIWQVGDHVILSRAPITGDVRFWNCQKDAEGKLNPAGGYMTVVPMVFGSALLMIIFSLLTRPPSRETIDKYFNAPRN
jgi:hypothetical protein